MKTGLTRYHLRYFWCISLLYVAQNVLTFTAIKQSLGIFFFFANSKLVMKTFTA